jgi:hypothetical protein
LDINYNRQDLNCWLGVDIRVASKKDLLSQGVLPRTAKNAKDGREKARPRCMLPVKSQPLIDL